MLSYYLSFIDDENSRIKFEELYYAYRKQMILVAKKYIQNDDDAQDVVHDVLVDIAAKHMSLIQSINDSRDVRNYLLTATKNRAINEIKRRDKFVSFEKVESVDLSKYSTLNDSDFIDLLCERLEYKCVLEAMLKLDEPYRDVLYYHFVVELKIADIAKLLDRKVQTVKKQLVRGKKQLLSILAVEGIFDNYANE